jgi:hypothetical protein
VLGAFAAALAGIGGVLVAAMVASRESETTDAAVEEFRWVVDAPPAATTAFTVFAVAATVAVITAVVLWKALPALMRRRRGRESDMQTLEREGQITAETEMEGLKRQRRWLIVLTAFLVATSVGFGAWAVSASGEDDRSVVALQGELTERQQQMLDFIEGEWSDAWLGGDGDAVVALFTAQGFHTTPDGSVYRVSDGSLAAYVDTLSTSRPDVVHRVVYENYVYEVYDMPFGTLVAVFEFTLGGDLKLTSMISGF